MENGIIKIEKALLREDIILCVKILNTTLIKEINENSFLSDNLKKEGKPTPDLIKAKAAVERLNTLLSEYIK